MALNYSHRPIFPAHLAEDNLVSPMRIARGCLVEGIPERNSIWQWPSNREVQDLDNNHNMDWDHVLPDDPFGMDISSTFEAITEVLEYLEAVEDYSVYGKADVGGVLNYKEDYSGYGRTDGGKEDSSIFAGWNSGWNFLINQAAINFHHSIPGNTEVDYNMLVGTVMVDKCNGGVGSKSTTENVEVGGSNGGVEILSASERVGFDEGIGTVGILTTTTNHVESNDGDNGGVGVPSTMKSVEFDDGNCCIDRIGIHQRITSGLVDADLDDGLPHPALSFGGVGSKSTTENVEVGGSNGGVEILHTSERVGFDEGIGAVGVTTATKRMESNDGGNGGVEVPSTTKCVEIDDGNCGIDRIGIRQRITSGLVDADLDDGLPHPALSFALAYLGVRDLLAVERVCKSLCSTVQNDPLLWRSIYIVPPLSERITDDILLNLTSRAQGNLQCLRLVSCQRITDSGLRRVLESNKRLTKLIVPECIRLSIDGIVSSLRAFQRVAVTGIKYLGIGGLHGMSQERFEEIVSLLGVHNYVQANYHKSHIYYSKNIDVTCEDDRPIDIEMCTRCQNFRRVYDCPAESCQGQDHNSQSCRACYFCIPRCSDCKKCMHGQYEETFTFDLVCSHCMLLREAKEDVKHSSSNHAVCQEQGSSING